MKIIDLCFRALMLLARDSSSENDKAPGEDQGGLTWANISSSHNIISLEAFLSPNMSPETPWTVSEDA